MTDVADVVCRDLAADLEAGGPDRAGRITAGNAAILRLVERMGALGPDVLGDDRPANDWIADWEALVAARSDVVDGLIGGGQAAELVVPQTADGYPITGRMVDAAPSSCEVAVTLAIDLD